MRKLLNRSAISAFVMLGLPCLAVFFAPADLGMGICMLLFFVLNPVYALVSGWKAGRDICRLWSSPAITALLFVAGTWLFLEWGETAFVVYALIYLLLGMAAMGISVLLKKEY